MFRYKVLSRQIFFNLFIVKLLNPSAMKRLSICFAIALFLFGSLSAQTPQAFKYQAVARDASGNIISDQDVKLRITILQGGASGNPVYIESHIVHTNQFGLLSIDVGSGTGIGDFSAIDWGNNIFFVKTEMDPAGGNNYSLMGISQLLSVPYALHSENTTNINDADADTTNELQSLNKVGNLIILNKGGGSVIDEVKDNDSDTKNELQKIFKLGNIVFLSDSGGSFIDEVNDLDHSTLNEIQHLYFDQNTNELSITAGNTVTLPSASLPAGTTGQTLHYFGGGWQANSNIYNSGNKVGIGTSSPIHKLDVYGSGHTLLRLTSGNHMNVGIELIKEGNAYNDYQFKNVGNELGLYSDNEDFLSTSYKQILSITNEGNVGIGTTNANFKLHVNDNAGNAIVANSQADTACAIFAASTEGIGIIAEHNGTIYSNPSIKATNYGSGDAIYAETNSASGRAVFAKAASLSGTNYAIYGLVESADGYAGYFEGGKNYFEGNVGIGTTSAPFSLNVRSTSANRSIYIYNRYSGSEDKFGIYSTVNSDGISDKYGLYSQVDGNPSGNNSLYGIYSFTNDNSSPGNTYGIYSYMTATGTGDHYAIYASTNDGWAGYFNSGDVFIADDLRIGNSAPVPGFKVSVDGNMVCERLKVDADDVNPAIRANNTGTGDGIYVDIDNPLAYAGYFNGGKNYFEGNIGIGTPNPDYPLHITSNSATRGISLLQEYNGLSDRYGIKTTLTAAGIGFRYGEHIQVTANSIDGSTCYGSYIQMTANGAPGNIYGVSVHCSSSGSGEHYGIYSDVPLGWSGYFANGNVYIDDRLLIGDNTGADGYKVSIDGKVMCEELKVQSSTAWPDYVFDKDYKLPGIDDLEKSILMNKRLPGMPSAETVNEEGITLGEMSKMQMEKIEELTLYIIGLNKKIKQLENEVISIKQGKP